MVSLFVWAGGSGCSLARPSGPGSLIATVKVLALRLNYGRIQPLPSSLAWLLAGLSFLWAVGPRASVPLWLLAGVSLSSLPYEPLYRVASQQGCWPPSEQASEVWREDEKDRSHSLFCNPMLKALKATSYCFCCILSVRSKSLGVAEVGVLGEHLRICPP